jgi:hypothetical protein
MLITIDSRDLQKLTGKLSELGKVQLPRAASEALNLTVKDVRKDLQQGAKTTFDSVVPFTVNSFRYTSSTPDRLEAVAYIRDDAPGGNPRPCTCFRRSKAAPPTAPALRSPWSGLGTHLAMAVVARSLPLTGSWHQRSRLAVLASPLKAT